MIRALLWVCFFLVVYGVQAWTVRPTSFFHNDRLTRARRTSHHQSRTTTTTSTSLHLFYKPPPASVATTRRLFLPESVEKDWNDGMVDFPYTFPVAVGKQQVFSTSRPAENNATLTIRLMEWKDLDQITKICVREYSAYTVPAMEPRSMWDQVTNSLDQATLGPYVKLSMILKLLMDYSTPNKSVPEDHAVVVASLCDIGRGGDKDEKLVGMVEVSRQPPLPDRNPPAIPFPLWLKEGYCRSFLKQSTQGWITNLLVVPECRGRGWAKALVMACEGIARRWGTVSIHLHCDASYRVPQKLYRSLGYQPELATNTASEYSWMSNNDFCQSSIYVIDGVPLLYMCKKLS